jgi:hypothetical protein
MSENIAIDASSTNYEITSDSPEAVVSWNGSHYSVIGKDDGETVYARGIPDEAVAYLIQEKVEEQRELAQHRSTKAPKAAELAEDDDVVFAITNEDGRDWGAIAACVWFVSMFAYGLYLIARGTLRTLTGDDK